MKITILTILSALFILSGNVLACGGGCKMGGSCGSADSCGESGGCSCSHRSVPQDILQTSIVPEDSIEVRNTLCPVTGETVDGMGAIVKYQYNRKVYNLCCGMCTAKFEEDPEKYSKIAEAKT